MTQATPTPLFEARVYHHVGHERLYRIYPEGGALYFICIGGARKFRQGGWIDLLLSLTAAVSKYISPAVRSWLENQIILWSTGGYGPLIQSLEGQPLSRMLALAPFSFVLTLGEMVDVALQKKRSEFLFGFHFAVWYFTDPAGVRHRLFLENEENFCFAYQALHTLFGHRLQQDKAMGKKEADPLFQYTMGYYFLNRHQDYHLARHWYLLAARQNIMPAQYQLGRFYQEGLGVPQDYATALQWYGLAANFQDMEAQNALARMYEHGLGVARDMEQAAHWYRLAAEQDFPEALYHMGRLCEHGLGVAMDLTEAARWYLRGSQFENMAARQALERLETALAAEMEKT